MDLLYSGNLDAFAIVSSDSDFTRLATRLRESGKTVYGLGGDGRRSPSSPPATGSSSSRCSSAPETRREGRERGDRGGPAVARAAPDPQAAIETASQDDGWASLGPVGNYLSKTHASFDPRNYGYPKLSALARAQDYLEVEQKEGRPPRVRLTDPAGQEGRGHVAGRRTRKSAQKAPAKKA